MPEIVYEDEWTRIICGDTLEVMADNKLVPWGQIQMAMTSVPYLRQRKYTEDGWGWEESIGAWLEHMEATAKAVRRVLSDTGVFWFNAGDKWGGSTSSSDYGDKRVNEAPKDYQKVKGTKLAKDSVNRKGNLMMLPERAVMMMADEEIFTLINKVIWYKPNRVAQSYTRKLIDTYEPLYLLAKNEAKYIWNRDDVGVEARGELNLMSDFKAVQEAKPFQAQSSLHFEEESLWRQQYDADHPPPFGTKEYTWWYENVRAKQSWHDHKNDAQNGQRKGEGGKVLKRPGGANPGDVWSIPVSTDNDFFGSAGVPPARYWPSWPELLCKLPILATSNPAEIVLDPFCGSGTLGVVAKHLGRKSILIDVDKDSCRVAAVRMMRAQRTLMDLPHQQLGLGESSPV